MPRVKFDYVVSFSSEDPENRATNLLEGEVSKKKWLCKKGEPSCSVVLQLPRAVEISAVHIGAHHAALVEALVGLSERPNDQFQVLVPSCVFVPPTQSRRDEHVDRVRSFTGEELSADTRGKRYDRVRIVCSQPYNKHCQYGLSFIHIHEPESRNDPPPLTPAAPAVPSRLFALDPSSDEDDFRPGQLFAKHFKSPTSENPGSSSTDAQIRQATSQALKNISDSSTKIMKTPINKAGASRQNQTEDIPTNRQRDSIMYTDDDSKPHDKIDRVVNRHKDEKADEVNATKNIDRQKNKEKTNRTCEDQKNKEKNNGSSKNSKKDSENKNNTNNDALNVSMNKKRQNEAIKDQKKKSPEHQSSKKRKRNNHDASQDVGEVCDDLSKILRQVTLALSGYEGARRAAVRDVALTLGARYSPNWTPQCTHLICAFPNTPKLRTARASRADAAVATADWLHECLKHRRRLPWQWYATIPAERTPVQPLPEEQKREGRQDDEAINQASPVDTDDEIEEALRLMPPDKRMNPRSTPSPPVTQAAPHEATTPDFDVCFVKDERFKGHVSLTDSDEDGNITEVEEKMTNDERIDPKKKLPDFFDGYTFVITDEVVSKTDRDLLARYVRAFGGLLIKESELDEDTQVDYRICSEDSAWGEAPARGTRVRPSWVCHCVQERRLCSPKDISFKNLIKLKIPAS